MFAISESRATSHANTTELQTLEEQTQQWWNIEAIWASIFKKKSETYILYSRCKQASLQGKHSIKRHLGKGVERLALY